MNLKYHFYQLRSKFRFWLYGRRQKEKAMLEMRKGHPMTRAGYTPQNMSVLSGETKIPANEFKKFWKEQREVMIITQFKHHLMWMKQQLKDLKDGDNSPM